MKYSVHERVKVQTTKIGHDVWVGQNVLVKQGVSIGTGAVIGMGSVVTKNVAPYTIVAGVPAREIKKRFKEDVIKQLLKSKWWGFSDEKLINYAKYFKTPEVFLKKTIE